MVEPDSQHRESRPFLENFGMLPVSAVSLLGALLFLGLYLASRYNYLLFHTIAETFSIVVAGGLFMIAWNSRRLVGSGFLLFLGIAYLFVAILHAVHMMAYKGMPIFFDFNADLPTQLWIAARYIESLSLVGAFVFLKRPVHVGSAVLAFTAITAALIVTIFAGWFPNCHDEGVGLTTFKIASEYAVCIVWLTALGMLYRVRNAFDVHVFWLVAASIVMSIVSELCMTIYVDVYGFSNLMGHFLKLVAFYLLYRAIIVNGLLRPYTLLFRELAQSEAALRVARDELEARVAERTAELESLNQQLRGEVEARARSEWALGERVKELRCLFEMTRLLENEEVSIESVLEHTARLLPPAFQYPDDTVAEVRFNDHVFKTGDVGRCASTIRTDLTLGRRVCGAIEVGYTHPHPDIDEGPFMHEERLLIDMIAQRLVRFIERHRSEQDRAKLQSQLVLAQRLEAVGRLAGGVAHDFNNMLSVILGSVNMILDDLPPDSPVRPDIEEIRKAAEHSADLTRQLLAFARQQTVLPKVVNVNEIIEGMLKMLRRLIGEDIGLTWSPSPEVWPIKIDPAQIEQILANLCVNSRDAIQGVGTISIETRNIAIDEAYSKLSADALPGEYVCLSVSDDGCGMDEATRENIFEPFFTTKAVGEGTGLGLAMVYGIVRQNNGFIHVRSEPGRGATFQIYLPRFQVTAEDATSGLPEETLPSRGETVLLVEDQEAVLELTRRMLVRLGYQVLTANTPEKALELAAAHTDSIQLLVTDVIMPAMNGRDLANRMREISPHTRVLFMSGYTADMIARRGILDDNVHFIPKPFNMRDLAGKIRETLDHTSQSDFTAK